MCPGDKGFDFVCPYGGPKFDPWMNVNGTRQQFSGFYEDALFDVAVQWIEENRERPFFAYVASKPGISAIPLLAGASRIIISKIQGTHGTTTQYPFSAFGPA